LNFAELLHNQAGHLSVSASALLNKQVCIGESRQKRPGRLKMSFGIERFGDITRY
jgi:hypothetical protein